MTCFKLLGGFKEIRVEEKIGDPLHIILNCMAKCHFDGFFPRILYRLSTGRNWRKMASSAWNTLITSFPSLFKKVFLKMTS